MTELNHKLSSFGLFCLGFGTITGVGWILLMGPWLDSAGSLGSMLAFAIGAVAILAIALCYAELCTLFPVAGGEIVFHLEAYGLSAAFLTGWFIALTYIAGIAYEAIAVGWLVTELLPQLKGSQLYAFLGHEVYSGQLAIGFVFMGLIGWLNLRGALGASRAQNWATIAFIAMSAMFVVYASFRGNVANLQPLFVGNAADSPRDGLFSVLAVTPFFYVGFNVIAQAMGERSRDLKPRSITPVLLGCVLAAAIFYLLVILATAVVLPREELLASTLPVGAAFAAAFGSVALGKLALVIGLLGLLTTWNALYFAAGRVLLGFGRASLMPRPFKAVRERSGTPSVALWFIGIMGGVGILFGQGAIVPIFNAMSGAMCVVFFFVCVAVTRLRGIPSSPRSNYRVPGGQAVPIVGAIFAAALAFISFRQALIDSQSGLPIEYTILLLWLLLGGVFWRISRKRRQSQTADERRSALLG